jgi:signal transduction histidine kinase
VTEFTPETLSIKVDKNQVQQVLLNLFLNAQEAMGEEGKIIVRTYKEPNSPPLGGKAACVTQISDTGEGIPPENLSKIFEPFFTTKRDTKGTGLGLPVSKMIVDNHGGTMMIQSEPGKGTDVKIVLPLEEGGKA